MSADDVTPGCGREDRLADGVRLLCGTKPHGPGAPPFQCRDCLTTERDTLRAEVQRLTADLAARDAAGVPGRFIDEDEAWRSARNWLLSIRESLQIDEHHSNPGEKAGGIIAAFSRSELVALAVVVRDDRNHSLLTKVRLSLPAPAQDVDVVTVPREEWEATKAMAEAFVTEPDKPGTREEWEAWNRLLEFRPLYERVRAAPPANGVKS